MQSKILFLTLRVFSATGGIEKVGRVIGKALYEQGLQQGWRASVLSLHDRPENADHNSYFPQLMFRGFSGGMGGFIAQSLQMGRHAEVLLLSHINLLPVGWLVKKFNPHIKLLMLAHGIEVWRTLPGWKKRMLQHCDLILPVSRFTRDKMMELYALPAEKFSIFNNCLDPFLELPLQQGRNEKLLQRFGLQANQQILLTVSRMVDSEKYKGYNRVLEALPALTGRYPGLRYLMAGKYDAKEKKRIDELITKLGLTDVVVFSGFVEDADMPALFTLADLFIMPSEKEGFGIVFIEAMFYGLPVIAGNRDGSADALKNGELGLMVNPDDKAEIAAAIQKVLDNKAQYASAREKVFDQFSYGWYKRKLRNCLESIKN